MSDENRFVFDTNAIVSALIFEHSTPGRAFFHAIEREKVLLSWSLVHELEVVLSRPKFDRYLSLEERERFITGLLKTGILVEIDQSIQTCRDPQDNHILELAICGRAACIITGDRDLLTLTPFRGIPILTPAQFVADILGNPSIKPD